MTVTKAWHKESELKLDKAGFFVILLNQEKKEIRVEHYLNVARRKAIKTGKLNRVIEGHSAEDLCHTIIREGLLSELTHAAYLGRELQRAEFALKNHLKYTQDEEFAK